MIVDGYLRVSQVNGREGESFISPSVQREQIEEWAESRGATIATVFEELEESGGRADRPMLMSALARVESGLTDGIVVATLDRFGRSLLDGLAAIDRIQQAGGAFVAVGDGFDLTTDTGKLVLRIMLSIAEWELDRVRSQWDTARERAVARGLYTGRCVPTGYRRTAARRLIPHRRTAPAIAEIFRRRAEGATLVKLAAYLTENKVPSSGERWQPEAVRRVIRNRVYLGEWRSGRHVNLTAHQPIVDQELWNAAQRRRTARDRGERKPTLLGGVLRCSGCRLALSSRTIVNANGAGQTVYACNDESPSGSCPSRAWISGRVVEPYIEASHFALLRAAERRGETDPKLRKLTAALDVARAETVRYRDSTRALRRVGADRFARGLADRVAREQRLRLALAAERLPLGALARSSATELEACWPTLSISERRLALGQTIEAAFVVRGPGRPEDRILVCARGRHAVELPRRSRTGKPLGPIHPDAFDGGGVAAA